VDAARRRRVPVLLACAALFTLLAGDDAGHAPGMALAVLASLWELVPACAPRSATVRSGRAALAAALVAWTIALRGTLATEVVYSVAMVVVLTAGALRGAGRSAVG